MAKSYNLDDQIRANKRSTVRLFVVLFLILFGLVFGVGWMMGLTPWVTAGFALVFGLVYLALASGFSIPAILAAARAREPDRNRREERMLVEVVEEMAIAAQMPVPKVYVQDSNDINAFATGKGKGPGVICATTGALRDLTREELQGVIGHEMAHILNQDVRVKTYAVALIGLIAMVSEMVWRAMFFSRGGGRKGVPLPAILVGIALMVLAPILSRLVYFAVSRKREYLADASGAYLTRNPEGLAAALEKILNDKPEPHHGDRTVAALYFANPFKRRHGGSVWSTHPPLEDRIRRLRGGRPAEPVQQRTVPPPPKPPAAKPAPRQPPGIGLPGTGPLPGTGGMPGTGGVPGQWPPRRP